ncbi:universal stress protein [Actinosynnema sp.]|uniref:universal stress protein n=1 Tax=Actinosynnema sp. TaxID=1872144 RepID=UPI003F848BC0
MNIGAIVVGVDGSERCRKALAWAMDEAVAQGRPLHVVNAWELCDEGERASRARSVALVENLLRQVCDGRDVVPEVVRHSVRGCASEVLSRRARGQSMLVLVEEGKVSASAPVVVAPAPRGPVD